MTAIYGMKVASSAGMSTSYPRRLTDMTMLAIEQSVRMLIIIRYRCCWHAMSSDISLRAWRRYGPADRVRNDFAASLRRGAVTAVAARGRATEEVQLAWLTGDMLSASTRRGGIAVRVRESSTRAAQACR